MREKTINKDTEKSKTDYTRNNATSCFFVAFFPSFSAMLCLFVFCLFFLTVSFFFLVCIFLFRFCFFFLSGVLFCLLSLFYVFSVDGGF